MQSLQDDSLRKGIVMEEHEGMDQESSGPESAPGEFMGFDTPERRQFLLCLGGISTMLMGGSAVAQPGAAPQRTLQRSPTARVSQVWGYGPAARRRLTPKAAGLMIQDLDALREGRVTERTSTLTWKDLSSIVDALGQQYGMNNHPLNPSAGSLAIGSKPAAASCCCCCTCCCGDCTFSVDCKSASLKAAE